MLFNYHTLACASSCISDKAISESIIEGKGERHRARKACTKRRRYAKGIECASDVIVTNVERNNLVTNQLLDSIVVSLMLGKCLQPNDPLTIKALSHAKSNDYIFAEIAYHTATKVKEKGGDLIAMYGAVVSLLVNRNVKTFRNVSFKKCQYESIAENSIKQVMPLLSFSVDIDNDDDLSFLLSELDSNSNVIQFTDSVFSNDNIETRQIEKSITEGSIAFSYMSRSAVSKSYLSKEMA